MKITSEWDNQSTSRILTELILPHEFNRLLVKLRRRCTPFMKHLSSMYHPHVTNTRLNASYHARNHSHELQPPSPSQQQLDEPLTPSAARHVVISTMTTTTTMPIRREVEFHRQQNPNNREKNSGSHNKTTLFITSPIIT